MVQFLNHVLAQSRQRDESVAAVSIIGDGKGIFCWTKFLIVCAIVRGLSSSTCLRSTIVEVECLYHGGFRIVWPGDECIQMDDSEQALVCMFEDFGCSKGWKLCLLNGTLEKGVHMHSNKLHTCDVKCSRTISIHRPLTIVGTTNRQSCQGQLLEMKSAMKSEWSSWSTHNNRT